MEQSIPVIGPKTTALLTRLAVPYILVGGSLLIIYFLILKAFGLHLITELRWFNFILLAPVIAKVSQKYISTSHGKSYLENFGLNFITFIGAFLILSIFMFFYLSFLDHQLMEVVRQSAFPELQLTPFNVCVLIMGEAVVAGVIISFATTQYYQYRIRKMA
jgi:hypothetical protein